MEKRVDDWTVVKHSFNGKAVHKKYHQNPENKNENSKTQMSPSIFYLVSQEDQHL